MQEKKREANGGAHKLAEKEKVAHAPERGEWTGGRVTELRVRRTPHR